MRLRWKKNPRPLGLASIGAGPRSSKLHDGVKEYASVNPIGGNYAKPLTGWYFVCPTDAVGVYMNTCNKPAPDEATAKAQAIDFIRRNLNTTRSE